MLKEQFFEAWSKRDESDDPDEIDEYQSKMATLLRQYADRNYSEVDNDRDLIVELKRDFERDIPPAILSEAIGCDVQFARDIRWMGYSRGVVDRTGSDRKSIPPSKRRELRERDNNQCVRCGSENELQPHHIIPLSHGGQDHKENLAMLCKTCHKKAHNGDFSTPRTPYDGKDEFWEEFAVVGDRP